VYYSPSGLLHKFSFNAIPVKEGALLTSVYDLNLVSSTREIARRKSKTSEKPGSAALYGGLVYDIDADKTKQEPQPDQNQGTQIRSMPPEGVMRGGWNGVGGAFRLRNRIGGSEQQGRGIRPSACL